MKSKRQQPSQEGWEWRPDVLGGLEGSLVPQSRFTAGQCSRISGPQGRTLPSIAPGLTRWGSCHQQRPRSSLMGSAVSRVSPRSVSYGHVALVGLCASFHDHWGCQSRLGPGPSAFEILLHLKLIITLWSSGLPFTWAPMTSLTAVIPVNLPYAPSAILAFLLALGRYKLVLISGPLYLLSPPASHGSHPSSIQSIPPWALACNSPFYSCHPPTCFIFLQNA